MRFISSFEAKFGTSHPVFYQGTYSQVHAKHCTFLLVGCCEIACVAFRLTGDGLVSITLAIQVEGPCL